MFKSFRNKAIVTHQMIEGKTLEDPPNPVHVDPFRPGGGAVATKAHRSRFLQQLPELLIPCLIASISFTNQKNIRIIHNKNN